ncbi:MAG: ATP-grasp domain-containing protein [Halomonas sp.]|nr:ATP-grasp domain-containing protein [Halomonas sp.]MCC5881605.1 ATP-grasp domain-containing protein [Halomonas sp.]
MMKKILFLGASQSQLPPIHYAQQQGYYVITVDYLPDNPGHVLADESHIVSTTDKEAVLELARRLSIDAIVAYASDPSAPTAAYVAEALGLPGNPYQSVELLARKDKFRTFLADNGFNVPRSRSFYSMEEARNWLSMLTLPVFVKPVDSSGNKGITCLEDPTEFETAFRYALKYSREKKVVLEERIDQVGFQIDSDVFLVDGKLRFWLWADAHFDPLCSPPFPIANSFPTTLDPRIGEKAAAELERLLTILQFRSGAFNVEFLVDAQGEIWFLEVGPRNGGDFIPDTILQATGIDLIKATVDSALGLDCSWLERVEPKGFWSNYVVHSLESGKLESIWFSDALRERVVRKAITAQEGDQVQCAKGSDNTLGVLVIRFKSQQEMLTMLANMHDHIKIQVTRAHKVVVSE